MFESLTYLNSMELSLMGFYIFLMIVAIFKAKSFVYQLPTLSLTVCMLIDMGTNTHGLFDMVIMFIMLLIPAFNIIVHTMTKNKNNIDEL